jgi:hypothetical protein
MNRVRLPTTALPTELLISPPSVWSLTHLSHLELTAWTSSTLASSFSSHCQDSMTPSALAAIDRKSDVHTISADLNSFIDFPLLFFW